MKFLQYLTITILFALTITSCSKEPTIEERLEGSWELFEVSLSGEMQEPTTNATITLKGENNGSTLEIEILDDQTSVLSGKLDIKTSIRMDGQELMSFDTEEEYNENRSWKLNEDRSFELLGTDSFGLGVLEDDQLIFRLDEMVFDAEEGNPFFNKDGRLEAELVFIKK